MHCFVACYVLLLAEIVHGLWSVTLEQIEFGCIHILYPEESDFAPAVCKPKLVTGFKFLASSHSAVSNTVFIYTYLKF